MIRIVFLMVLFLGSFESVAGPASEAFCLDSVHDVVTHLVESWTGRKNIPIFTEFETYSGLHEKQYKTFATVGAGGMLVTYTTRVFEFESPSTRCDILSINKGQ
jgi:hypothetical protein